MIEQAVNPQLNSALKTHGKLGLYSFAAPLTREFLMLTHSPTALRVLTLPAPEKKAALQKEGALILYFSSPALFRDIGHSYERSGETARQNVRESFINRHQHLSPNYQQAFPLRELLSIHNKYLPREYRLLIRGNVGSSIMELISAGNNLDQMAEDLSMSKETLLRRLRLLRGLGIDVPKIPHSPLETNQLLANLSDQSKSDMEIRKLFLGLTVAAYELGLKKKMLISFTKLARNLGYHASRKNITLLIRAIQKDSIPFDSLESKIHTGPQKGTQRRIVLVAWHKDRVAKALAKDEAAQKLTVNPVSQVSGKPTKEIPTTWQLRSKKGFIPIGQVLLHDYSIKYNSNMAKTIRENLILHNFTGHIFRYHHTLYLNEAEKSILKQYLDEFLGIVLEISAD